MAKFIFPKAETSVILPVFIQDSSATDGSGLGSLDQTSSIVGGYMKRNGTGVALAVDENVTTEGTYEAPSTAAQVSIGTPANMRTGCYELHFHNDLFTTADYVLISLGGATNMAELMIEIQLSNLDLNDGVRAGLTAMPNAAADAAGGLPISDAGGLDLDTILDAAISTRSDFDETADPVELLDTGGAAGTSAEELVDDIWDEELTGATHNVATSSGRRLRNLQDFGVYEGGAIWIDTVNGVAGTTDFENGTVNNPVDTIADALTLAASVGLDAFQVLPGSSITLGASVDGYEFRGFSYTIALNGQSVSGTKFIGATVSGNDDGSNGTATVYERCGMGSNTLGANILLGCRMTGDVVLAEAADYFWDQCYSGVAGTGTPSVDLESAAETKNLSIRHYSGGMELKNHGAGSGTHNTSIEGFGQVVLNANCAGGTVAIRGNFTVTDNASGAVTLSDNARIDVLQDPRLLVRTTIATAPDATTLTLTAGSADNDAYNGCLAVFTDATGAPQKMVASIEDYVGATKTVTISNDPSVFTYAAGDRIDIVGQHVGAETVEANVIDVQLVNGSSLAADNLALGTLAVLAGTVDNTVAPTTTVFEADDITTAAADHYNGRTIIFTSGTLQYQATDITDYALVAGRGRFTVTALTSAPANDVTFLIV